MMRAILIHGWDGYPEEGWFPKFKKDMEEQGFVVTIPAMEPAGAPQQAKWVPQLAGVVGVPDEDTYLVGHSAGCITILRYLEGLPEGAKVGGVVLVAGFTDPLGFEELKNYFATPIDWSKIRSKADEFIAIHSDNDEYVPLSHADVFKERLGAEVVILHDRKHFEDGSGITDLPEARDAVLRSAGV
ncbi:serine hydrolase family protein [Candidatus Uhrbacteria bacterium]|nr:serine hydrolase family protein [Candidatus Uhrbacteria bacterium]